MKKLLLCILMLLMTAPLISHQDRTWEIYKRRQLPALDTITGWCNQEKAIKMMDLIYRVQPEVCVEIGAYAGKSIYPTACALRFLKKGVIYAIDPWDPEPCKEGLASDDEYGSWWVKLKFEEIYQGFLAMLKAHRLESYCSVMRMTDIEAREHFPDGSIDILHIDGNHAPEVALRDAYTYLVKMKKGGYIWFDDANWSQTQQAVAFLKEHCELIPEFTVPVTYNAAGEAQNSECLLFRVK